MSERVHPATQLARERVGVPHGSRAAPGFADVRDDNTTPDAATLKEPSALTPTTGLGFSDATNIVPLVQSDTPTVGVRP